ERAGLRREPAGAVRDDEMRKLEQLLPAMPLRQAQERVHAEQQAERPRAVFRAKALERIDRVGDAAACDLAVVRDEPFVTRNGRLNHAQAQLRLRDRRAAMRRRADRHEVNALEAQPLLELERRAQMPVVDRIEGAAEYADRLAGCRRQARPCGRSMASTRLPSASQAGTGPAPLTAASVSAAWRTSASSRSRLKRASARRTSGWRLLNTLARFIA